MKWLIRALIVFLMVTAAVFLVTQLTEVQFGRENYWDHRGIFFLVFVAIFPRLTLLFSSVASGGILWWLSWLLVPRFLVAILATISYWYANPVLVVIAWLFALGGESSEKVVVFRRPRPRFHFRSRAKSNVIDADYTRIEQDNT